MSGPRRYLIAAGTRHYRELGELDGVDEDVARIVALFATMGYERVLTDVSDDPDAGGFEYALAAWCAGGGLAAGDVVVVYYAGHGDQPTAGPYRLACAGSTAMHPRSWLSLDNLAAILAESPVRDVLFIVDACNAGLGADELGAVTAAFGKARGGEDPASGTWVLASARRRERAWDKGHFTRELARAYTTGDGPSQRRLSPAVLTDRINRAFVTAGRAQRAVCSVTDQSVQPPFFPNPAFDPAAEIGPDGRAEGEAGDLTAHFEPRGRGVEHVHDPGSYFTGRAHALDVVRTRLAGPGGRGPLAVTGAPGSGKSALLGRIVLEGDTSGGTPPIDVSINARHQTIDALIGRLAGAADVRASSVDALLAALAGRQAPYRVVVDSLDEAGPGHDIVEARRIAWELLRPLGDVPCVRLVVGSRRELLSDWCKHAPIVDLDADAYADDTNVADYVERILADGRSPYADTPDTARVIARAVARRAGRCFLVARMTASALVRQEPVDVTAPGWADTLPSDVDGAFRAYLERLPSARRATALTLLTTLAFAEGHGLPRAGVWTEAASRLSGATVCERDIDELVDEEGSYLTSVDVGGHRYFRLYHQELTDHLRERALASRDLADIQACFVATLLGLTPRLPNGTSPDWARARPYVRYHLATHSAAAGTIGELLTDPGFVLAAGTADLLRAVRRSVGTSMLPLVIERCAEVLRNRGPDRAAQLAFVARAIGEHRFADRALALSASTERVSLEARSVTPHRIVGHHSAGGFSVNVINMGWWIEEVRSRDRSLVLALPPAASCVHVWVPDDPAAGGILPHPNPVRSAAAFVDAHGRPVAITLDGQGCIRMWDVDDATSTICPHNPPYERILDAGVLNDGTCVVACTGWDGVDVLETTTGRVVLHVEDLAPDDSHPIAGRLIHTPGAGLGLAVFHTASGVVALHKLEGDQAGTYEILVEGVIRLLDIDIARNSAGETFLALLEGPADIASGVTLIHVGGRSVSFQLHLGLREWWGGFVRIDDEPAYLIGDPHLMCTLPLSGGPLHITSLDPKPVSFPTTWNTGRSFVVRAGWKGAVHVVDAADGMPVGAPLLGHESAVCALRVLSSSPLDGLNILAVGTDGTVRLWNWWPPTTTDNAPIAGVHTEDAGYARPRMAEAWTVLRWPARPNKVLVASRYGVHALDTDLLEHPNGSWTGEAVPGLPQLGNGFRYEDDDGVLNIFTVAKTANLSVGTAWHRLTLDGRIETTRFPFPQHRSDTATLHLIPPSDAHTHPRLVSVDRERATTELALASHGSETVLPLPGADDPSHIWGGSTAVATATGQALLLIVRGRKNPNISDSSIATEILVRDAAHGHDIPDVRFRMPFPVTHMAPYHSRTGTRYIACVEGRRHCAVLDLLDGHVHPVTTHRGLPNEWARTVKGDSEHHYMRWVRLPTSDALLLWMLPDLPGNETSPVRTWSSARPDRSGTFPISVRNFLWSGNSPNGEALVLLADEHGIVLCHLPGGTPVWQTSLPAWINDATVLDDFDIALATQQGVVLLRPRISPAWRRRLGLARG
nr:caspase family protein [Embleya hyalina]